MDKSPRTYLLRRLLPPLLLGAAVLLAGCSSTRSLTDVREPADTPFRTIDAANASERTAVEPSASEFEASLRSEIDGWLGVPHVYGGMSKSGVDCSGFVLRIYSDLLGVELPRTTERQKDEGRSVLRTSLRAGDLVFFKPDPKTRHVGIMLNAREFAHASGSRGVMISGIDEPYWRNRYWLARRVVSDSGLSAADIEPPSDPEPVRMSW